MSETYFAIDRDLATLGYSMPALFVDEVVLQSYESTGAARKADYLARSQRIKE